MPCTTPIHICVIASCTVQYVLLMYVHTLIHPPSTVHRGAVAADGRIQAGDLILNVNDVDFSNLTNDEAVKVLRDVVQASGPISLTVARPIYDGVEEMPTFEPRSKFMDPRCVCNKGTEC